MRRLTSRRTPMRTPAMTATEVRGLSTRVRENGKVLRPSTSYVDRECLQTGTGYRTTGGDS